MASVLMFKPLDACAKEWGSGALLETFCAASCMPAGCTSRGDFDVSCIFTRLMVSLLIWLRFRQCWSYSKRRSREEEIHIAEKLVNGSIVRWRRKGCARKQWVFASLLERSPLLYFYYLGMKPIRGVYNFSLLNGF